MKGKNISFGLCSCLLLLLGSGCLKDKDYDNGKRGIIPNKNSRVVEIEGAQNSFKTLDLIETNSDTTLDQFVTIRLASDQPAQKDIQVTLAVNPAIVAAYNAKYGTLYETPAASLYSIPDLTVTIPKGERRAYLKLTTRVSNLNGPEYALGIQITGVSDGSITISGNFGKQVVALAKRNRYDGIYDMSINTKGWAAYGIADDNVFKDWPRTVELVTANPGSVNFNDPEGNGALQPGFTSGGGATAFGGTTPQFKFDVATNKMTAVVNTTPPDSRNRKLSLNPAVTDSRYDPVTKKIHAAYLLSQDGRPNMEINIIFTFVGQR